MKKSNNNIIHSFDQIKNSIQGDIKKGCHIEITEETAHSIWIYDEEEICSREYQLTDPAVIHAKWIMEKIIVTPSVLELPYSFDIKNLILYLDQYLDKNMLMTLQNIVFCGDLENDFDYLRDYNDDFYQELECSDLP